MELHITDFRFHGPGYFRKVPEDKGTGDVKRADNFAGFTNEINQAGVDYYNNLINALLEVGIEPLVTLFHWDTPYVFSYLGDWTNPKIVEYFSDFADLAFELFGDRVMLFLSNRSVHFPQCRCFLGEGEAVGYNQRTFIILHANSGRG